MKAFFYRIWTATSREIEKPGSIPWLVHSLGVLGWILIIRSYPFHWELPKYAKF